MHIPSTEKVPTQRAMLDHRYRLAILNFPSPWGKWHCYLHLQERFSILSEAMWSVEMEL